MDWTYLTTLSTHSYRHILIASQFVMKTRSCRIKTVKFRAMTDEQKELFTKYADCVREYQVMAECLLFRTAFAWAAE